MDEKCSCDPKCPVHKSLLCDHEWEMEMKTTKTVCHFCGIQITAQIALEWIRDKVREPHFIEF